MIITRTPFRISFFGGGTDHRHWYERHGGEVLSTTINKYCYVSCRWLPPFFVHRHRIVWSKIELVHDVDEIVHPTVRSVLRFLGAEHGVEIHHDADLPARTGIGSSSSFAVGLLHALHLLKGGDPDKRQLALEAIHVEQNLNKENVGVQDQTAASFGGLNHIAFGGRREIDVRPVHVAPARLRELESHLMLFFTGQSRTSSDIAAAQIRNARKKTRELKAMQAMVKPAMKILRGKGDLSGFGRLLHESWELKRTLAGSITNSLVDEIYSAGRSGGAVGGKLLGAGGGGFILFFVPPERRGSVLRKLDRLLHVPFRFETEGTKVVFRENDMLNGGHP